MMKATEAGYFGLACVETYTWVICVCCLTDSLALIVVFMRFSVIFQLCLTWVTKGYPGISAYESAVLYFLFYYAS